MKAKNIVGWLLLLGGATYGYVKAESIRDQLADNGLAIFFFLLLALVIIWAIARILNN